MEADLSNRTDPMPGRFVPAEARGQLVEAEQVVRYWWTSPLAAGRRVLDAGCGVGYGTRLLATAGADEVVGVDIAEAVVEVAAATARPNTTFRQADVRDLPFDDGAFELIACFDVIEQVESPQAVIDELARVLHGRGVLAMSSHELVPGELEAALRARFEQVALRRQHDWLGSAILDHAAGEPEGMAALEGMRVARARAAEPGGEALTIALAGNAPLPSPAQAMVLTGLPEVRKWHQLWEEQQEVLTGQHERLEQLRSKKEELDALHSALRRSEQELARLPELELAEARLHGLLQRVDQLETKADEVYNSFSWRVTRPLRSAKRIWRRGRPAQSGG